jgi:hypothetical protein
VYLASCRSLSSSSKSEFVKTRHSRISTGDVDKIPTERPLSKMRARAHDPKETVAILRSTARITLRPVIRDVVSEQLWPVSARPQEGAIFGVGDAVQ